MCDLFNWYVKHRIFKLDNPFIQTDNCYMYINKHGEVIRQWRIHHLLTEKVSENSPHEVVVIEEKDRDDPTKRYHAIVREWDDQYAVFLTTSDNFHFVYRGGAYNDFGMRPTIHKPTQEKLTLLRKQLVEGIQEEKEYRLYGATGMLTFEQMDGWKTIT